MIFLTRCIYGLAGKIVEMTFDAFTKLAITVDWSVRYLIKVKSVFPKAQEDALKLFCPQSTDIHFVIKD